MSRLLLNPMKFRDVAEVNDHPLLHQRRFYTLPLELLEAIVERVGENNLDPDTLALDRRLSPFNGDHSHHIGFHGGLPILYDLLAEPGSVSIALTELTEKDRKEMGWPETFGRNLSALRAADERGRWVRNVCRGYAGWLSMNPQFAREQASLFTSFADQIRTHGLGVGAEPKRVKPEDASPLGAPELIAAFVAARDTLLDRWHLQGLAGPFLPNPVRTMMPFLNSTGAKLEMGSLLFLAQIFPLPDRQMLREMIEESLNRDQAAEHLQEWMEIVQADSSSKKSIERFGRIFLLQHFWRVIFSRYATAVSSRTRQLRSAMASWLFPQADGPELIKKEETIRKDLDDLAHARGGSDWPRRFGEYTGF